MRALALFAVSCAKVLDDGRVDLGGDAFGPTPGVEEITGAQEVDEHGRHRAIP